MGSNIPLEAAAMRCRMDGALDQLGTYAFAREFIAIQAREACDELGDTIVEGDEVVEAALAAADMPSLDRAKARAVALAIVGCLQRRYSGECAVTNCSGREQSDQLVNGVAGWVNS